MASAVLAIAVRIGTDALRPMARFGDMDYGAIGLENVFDFNRPEAVDAEIARATSKSQSPRKHR